MALKYLVKPGDTVMKIIEKNHSSANKFEYHNDINNLKFIASQMVLVPLQDNTSIRLYQYMTKDNDSIAEISTKYSVSCEEIKYFNRYDNLILTENQEVIVEEVVSQVINEFDN